MKNMLTTRQRFLAALARVPAVEPEAHDRLPAAADRALQPTSRTRRKAKSKKKGRAARG